MLDEQLGKQEVKQLDLSLQEIKCLFGGAVIGDRTLCFL